MDAEEGRCEMDWRPRLLSSGPGICAAEQGRVGRIAGRPSPSCTHRSLEPLALSPHARVRVDVPAIDFEAAACANAPRGC